LTGLRVVELQPIIEGVIIENPSDKYPEVMNMSAR